MSNVIKIAEYQARKEHKSQKRREQRAQVKAAQRPLEPPDLPDTNRCQAWHQGGQCALDIGHYKPNLDPNPCPHILENGTEWFGVGDWDSSVVSLLP